MSAKMKTWTWRKLNRFLRDLPLKYPTYADQLPLLTEIEICPGKYRKALAAAFSVAKRTPGKALPKHPCGLCTLYEKFLDSDCDSCPLCIREGESCYHDGSLFHRAYHDNDEEAERKLYAALCAIYKEEYDKLLEEKTLEEAGSTK